MLATLMESLKPMTLYDLLDREIKRMVSGFTLHSKGNIHPLIMNEIEKYIIEIVLRETNFNYVLTAKMLGIGRSTLYRRIQALGIAGQPPLQ
jgi:transcriptional regulator with PAS, ATPase and Fis domain